MEKPKCICGQEMIFDDMEKIGINKRVLYCCPKVCDEPEKRHSYCERWFTLNLLIREIIKEIE